MSWYNGEEHFNRLFEEKDSFLASFTDPECGPCFRLKAQLKRLVKDIEKLESKLTIAKADLNTALESTSKAISSESDAYRSKESILKEHSKLSKEVSKMNADKDEFKKIVKCSSKLKQAIDMDMEEVAKLKTDKTKLAKQKRDAVKDTIKQLKKKKWLKYSLK